MGFFGDAWDWTKNAVGNAADSDFGVVDAALPFWGATHAALKGVKAGANALGAGIGGGGSGDYVPYEAGDAMNFRYGGDPSNPNPIVSDATRGAFSTGAAAANNGRDAANLGQTANQIGYDLLGTRTSDAIRFDQRAAQQGDWTSQDATLGQLGGIEATEGPSAAQAQLAQGTSRGLAGQLALARSGRGFGGSAATAGLAQGGLASTQANATNEAAMLRAQENDAWRRRQAGNLTNVAGMQGQQSQADLGAAIQSRGQNDAATLGLLGMGQDAYFGGVNAGMQGYGIANQGYQTSLAGQGLANDIRGQEMTGNTAYEDAKLRVWAAQNGYELAQQQASAQKDAAVINGVSSGVASYYGAKRSDIRSKTRIAPDRGEGTEFGRILSNSTRFLTGAPMRPEHPVRRPASRAMPAAAPPRRGDGFASGLAFDGELYRPGAHGGSSERPAGFRGSSARPSTVEAEGQALSDWVSANGLTPMQQEYMAPREVTSGGQRVTLKQPDYEALDAVREAPGSFYDYKDPKALGAAPGRHYGPMAQDLAKTPAGASAVVKQPDGSLGVDTGRLALVNTGAVSAQQQQIDDLSAQLDELLGKQANDNGDTNARYYGGSGR